MISVADDTSSIGHTIVKEKLARADMTLRFMKIVCNFKKHVSVLYVSIDFHRRHICSQFVFETDDDGVTYDILFVNFYYDWNLRISSNIDSGATTTDAGTFFCYLSRSWHEAAYFTYLSASDTWICRVRLRYLLHLRHHSNSKTRWLHGIFQTRRLETHFSCNTYCFQAVDLELAIELITRWLTLFENRNPFYARHRSRAHHPHLIASHVWSTNSMFRYWHSISFAWTFQTTRVRTHPSGFLYSFSDIWRNVLVTLRT